MHNRVPDEDRLDLSGVNVDPAGDDHVLLTIADEEETVIVQLPDVADGVALARKSGLRSGCVVVILESVLERHEHLADLRSLPRATQLHSADVGMAHMLSSIWSASVPE